MNSAGDIKKDQGMFVEKRICEFGTFSNYKARTSHEDGRWTRETTLLREIAPRG
jgi:hypothetical protein